MTEETKQVEELKQEEELITKPKKKRVLTAEQKQEFLERMKTGRDKKKNNHEVIKVESVYKAPPVEPVEPAEEYAHIPEKKKRTNKTFQKLEELELSHKELLRSNAGDVKELLDFVREYKEKKTRPDRPKSNVIKPEDVYQNRVNQLKKDYLNTHVYNALFGE